MEPIMMNNLVNFYLFTMLCNIFVIKLCYFSAIKSILQQKKILVSSFISCFIFILQMRSDKIHVTLRESTRLLLHGACHLAKDEFKSLKK